MNDLVEAKPRRKRSGKQSKPLHAPAAASPQNEATVREAAYYLWEAEGRPDGRDLEHWLHILDGGERALPG
jgi:hypothetical protein